MTPDTKDVPTCSICAQPIGDNPDWTQTKTHGPMHRWMSDCITTLRDEVRRLTQQRDALRKDAALADLRAEARESVLCNHCARAVENAEAEVLRDAAREVSTHGA